MREQSVRPVLLAFTLCLLPTLSAQCVRFWQPTDTIRLTSNTRLSTAATLEAVVWLDGPNSFGSLFNEWTDSVEDKRLRMGPNFLEGYGLLSQGAPAYSGPISVGGWHHVAYVYEPPEQRLYLDGVRVATLPGQGPFFNGPGLGFLGASTQPGMLAFRGLLDSFRISSTARYSGTNFVPPVGDLAADAGTLVLYNFNEPASSTTVTDLSGSGNHGTLGVGFAGATSPTLGAWAARCVKFQSGTDAIRLTYNTILSNAATFEAMVWLDGPNSLGSLFNEWTNNVEDKRLRIGPNFLEGYGWLSQGAPTFPGSVSVGAWHHVAYVYDQSQQRLYLDGVLVATLPARGNFLYNGPGLGFLGASTQPGMLAFRGLLDSFRISSTARYSGLSFVPPMGDLASDGNTLVLYNFNEPASSTTVTDLSGSGNHGTLGVGFAGATSPLLGDIVTQEAYYRLFGTGCAGANGVPVLAPVQPNQIPRIGRRFDLQIRNLRTSAPVFGLVLLGLSSSGWGPIALPLDLSSLCMPGCALLVSADLPSLGLFSLTGTAVVSIDIPNNASLLGGLFFNQAIVVDSGANCAGMVVSNAGEGRIGW